MGTDLNIAQRVLEESGRTEAELPLPRLIAMVPQGLSALSYSVGRDPDRRRRQLLRRTFDAVAVANGTGDLTALVTGDRPPILELNEGWGVSADGVTGNLQNVVDPTAGANDKPPEFTYFWVTGLTINVANGDGTPYTGNVYITANYLATVNDLYGELDDNLIRLMLERIGAPTPPEPAEAEARR